MGSAARARQLVKAGGSVTASEEESRAYLQTRLTIFLKAMFWSFVTLIVSLTLMYRVYPDIRPRNQDLIFAGAIGGLIAMAFIWRVLLIRHTTLSLRVLYGLDAFVVIAIGCAFAAAAFLAADLRPAGYASLMYWFFAVFTRALIVPSSARRTAVLAGIAAAPMIVSGIGLALTRTQELEGPAYVGGVTILSLVGGVLAATGSRIIYGLRRQVSEAMQLGAYTLGRKIGEGGMGAVYLAQHSLLRRPTAVKLLLPDRVGAENLARFELEVQHMSQLTHPNTVAVFDYGHSDGVFYYAMEYLGGGINLEELVATHGPQPAGRVIHILAQVCGALREAHDRGIIHRDIKPPNIILCERGGMPDIAKVVDFGLVKEITADTGASTQIVLGTPAYIAPETLTGAAVGPAVDLYSLGAVGYFLLTGKRVFTGATAIEVCMKHATDAPVPPSQVTSNAVPAALEALILACLAKRPSDRPESASALADQLRALAVPADWRDDDARRWWREFTASRKPLELSTVRTLTITVDRDHRDLDVRSA